ncbi:inositol monophosphatase family protein [Fictibacillus aquaticus]|uniref:inositol monophosphatase family protein n=1 Tax=Fictibacillus aquaticus TaxID=2021314 RepID=UPI001F0AA69E|nr:inositol monophosphatase family protein [Fictibacillus aquaticus]
MENVDWLEIKRKADAWIFEAGKLIRNSFNGDRTITYKSHAADLVTEMDKGIERFFIKNIRESYPDHQVLGEEGYGDEISDSKGVLWIIDPIDGTTNFIHQQTNFAVSVGIYHNGTGILGFVYDVARDEMFFAEKSNGIYLNGNKLPSLQETVLEESVFGINATWLTPNRRIDHTKLLPIVKRSRGTRSYGSAALEMAYVASGRIDAYLTMRLSPWDFAAGKILIEEAGGIVTTVEGSEISLLQQNSVFCGKPGLHEQVMNEIILGKK